MCTNRPEFLEVLYAAQRIGLRFTPINWHLTGPEAAYIVENCEAKAFVCSGELGDKVAVAAGSGRAGTGQDQHGRLPARLRDVQRRGRRRGRLRHRGPGDRHPDALHLGHHGAAQGRAPRDRRRQRARRRQLLRLRRGLGDQHRRASPDGAPLPRGPACLLGRGALPLRRAHRDHGPLGPGRGAAPGGAARDHAHPHGADDVPPPPRRCRRRSGSASTPRRCAT